MKKNLTILLILCLVTTNNLTMHANKIIPEAAQNGAPSNLNNPQGAAPANNHPTQLRRSYAFTTNVQGNDLRVEGNVSPSTRIFIAAIYQHRQAAAQWLAQHEK